jgi:putative transcriptional regulator
MNRIKEVLKERGISQTWLADKMGKSYNTINEYARNKRQPSIKVLFTIAEILNMEAKELIEKRDLKDNK